MLQVIYLIATREQRCKMNMREKLEKYAMIKYIEDKTELSFIAWLNNQLNKEVTK